MKNLGRGGEELSPSGHFFWIAGETLHRGSESSAIWIIQNCNGQTTESNTVESDQSHISPIVQSITREVSSMATM